MKHIESITRRALTMVSSVMAVCCFIYPDMLTVGEISQRLLFSGESSLNRYDIKIHWNKYGTGWVLFT